MKTEKTGFWQKLQNVDRRVLYLILVVTTSVLLSPMFANISIPDDPEPSSKALYYKLMSAPDNKTVFVQSDWTISTRGENAAHLEALLRVLMSRHIKFVIFTVADPQAPGVYRDVIRTINSERKSEGLKEYKLWEDYLDLKYFPNAEGTLNAIASDVRKAFGGVTAKDPTTGQDRNVFESPVLANVRAVSDASLYMIVTASSSIDRAVERLNEKATLALMCTGVIGPSAIPWFQAGQVKGVAVGLRGGLDVEYMMKHGLNYGSDPKTARWAGHESQVAPPVSEGKSLARANLYFLSFHGAIILLILAVVVGNIGMFVTRKKRTA